MAKYKKSNEFMSMMELSDMLGTQIRASMQKGLSKEEREIVNAQSKFLIGLANQHINAFNFMLNGEKLLAENGSLNKSIIEELIDG